MKCLGGCLRSNECQSMAYFLSMRTHLAQTTPGNYQRHSDGWGNVLFFFCGITHGGRVFWRPVYVFPVLRRRGSFQRRRELSWRRPEVAPQPRVAGRRPGRGGQREGRAAPPPTAEGSGRRECRRAPARWRSGCRSSRCRRGSPVDPDVCIYTRTHTHINQYANRRHCVTTNKKVPAYKLTSH